MQINRKYPLQSPKPSIPSHTSKQLTLNNNREINAMMTDKQIQKEINTAENCLELEEPLDKKLDLAEYRGDATYRIKQAIKRNTAKLDKALEKLARAEMSGIEIDYDCGTLATLVHEEKEEIECREGE